MKMGSKGTGRDGHRLDFNDSDSNSDSSFRFRFLLILDSDSLRGGVEMGHMPIFTNKRNVLF